MTKKELEQRVENLTKLVVEHNNLLKLLDSYMLFMKKFFDQIKLNEAPKEEPKQDK